MKVKGMKDHNPRAQRAQFILARGNALGGPNLGYTDP